MSKGLQNISSSEQKLLYEALRSVAVSFAAKHGIENFLNKVLTEGERVTIGRRLLIAQLILSNKTYFEINEKLSVSPNTYSKVRKWLQSELPDYELVLAQYATTSKTAKRQRIKPFSFKHLQKKYPMHFLLVSLTENLLNR